MFWNMESVIDKSCIIRPNSDPIYNCSLFKVHEVIPKFVSELIPRNWIGNHRVRTPCFIHVICLLEGNSVASRKDIVVRLNVIEENVGLQHHVNGTVVSIEVFSKTPICRKTVCCDRPKFKPDLVSQHLVFLGTDFPTTRTNINQTPDDSRLRISDLYRLVGSHEEKSINPRSVSRFMFLVHKHVLVRNNTVQLSIIFDARQVSILLDCNKRITSKSLCGKEVVIATKTLRIESRSISFKELFDNI